MIPTFSSLTKGQIKRRKQNSFVMPVGILVLLFLVGQAFWLSGNKHMFRPFSVMKIDCDVCQRTGIIRDPANRQVKIMCPSCFGVGYHTVRRFDNLDGICPACGGMGRVDVDGAWVTCPRCDGRGVYRVEDWKKLIELDRMDFENDRIIKQSEVEELEAVEPEIPQGN